MIIRGFSVQNTFIIITVDIVTIIIAHSKKNGSFSTEINHVYYFLGIIEQLTLHLYQNKICDGFSSFVLFLRNEKCNFYSYFYMKISQFYVRPKCIFSYNKAQKIANIIKVKFSKNM